MKNARVRFWMDIAASAAMIVAAGALVAWVALSPKRSAPRSSGDSKSTLILPTEPLSLTGAHIRGSSNAKVTLLVFSDFECPYCSQFANNGVAEFTKRFVDSGEALVAFEHFPLLELHDHAMTAAIAAECAGQHGKFWEFHDAVFRGSRALSADKVRSVAESVGVNRSAYEACNAQDLEKLVRKGMSLGEKLSVTGTPAVFLGTNSPDGKMTVTARFEGAVKFSDLESATSNLLKGSK